MFSRIFLIAIFISSFTGCFQASDQDKNTEQAGDYNREGPKDDLLKLYDRMVSARQKQLNQYSKETENNTSSGEFFYKRALAKLEILDLQDALSECWQYKDSTGHQKEERLTTLYSVLFKRSNQGLGEEVKRSILNHPVCFQMSDSGELVNAYERRVMDTSYEEIHAPTRDLAKAIELDPRLGQAYIYRADYSSRQSQETDDERIEDYSKGLNLAPDPKVFIRRALLYVNRNKLELAYQDCNHAINLNPQYSDAYVLRAIVYRFYSKCLNAHGNILNDRSETCLRREAGNKMNDFKTALAIEPGFPLLSDAIGEFSKVVEEDNPEAWEDYPR